MGLEDIEPHLFCPPPTRPAAEVSPRPFVGVTTAVPAHLPVGRIVRDRPELLDLCLLVALDNQENESSNSAAVLCDVLSAEFSCRARVEIVDQRGPSDRVRRRPQIPSSRKTRRTWTASRRRPPRGRPLARQHGAPHVLAPRLATAASSAPGLLGHRAAAAARTAAAAGDAAAAPGADPAAGRRDQTGRPGLAVPRACRPPPPAACAVHGRLAIPLALVCCLHEASALLPQAAGLL